MMDSEEIADRLRRARASAGYSNAMQAALALGIPYSTVAGHENGSRGLGRMLDEYTKHYGVSADWLLHGEGQGPLPRPDPSAELREAIQIAVNQGSTTYKALSAAIGRNDTYVQQFITKGVPRELRERDERAIREVLGNPALAPRSRGFVPTIVPGRDLVGDKNFPVYAAAMGGNGHQIVTFEAIDYVKRPAILENVKNSYGVYIVGESMMPAFEPGDMALVHPHLPPARDKNVVLFHTPPSDEAECIIKRLLTFSDRDWRLRQYNPAEDFTESRVDWPICHRVVGKYESR